MWWCRIVIAGYLRLISRALSNCIYNGAQHREYNDRYFFFYINDFFEKKIFKNNRKLAINILNTRDICA